MILKQINAVFSQESFPSVNEPEDLPILLEILKTNVEKNEWRTITTTGVFILPSEISVFFVNVEGTITKFMLLQASCHARLHLSVSTPAVIPTLTLAIEASHSFGN